MKILIHGGGLQGLSCGFSLNKNHEVGIVANDLHCLKSKFFKHVYSGFNLKDGSFMSILDNEHYDVLIPVSDICVPFVSKHKKMIEEKYDIKVAVPDYECVYQVEDKNRFMSFCERNGLPHPKTIALNDSNIDIASNIIGFPALIKPNYSVGARGITCVNNVSELIEKYPAIVETFGSCTLQEFIKNQEYYYNVMMYRDESGNILASAIIKIVRMYPVKTGSSSCCISVEDPELLEICKRTLDALNWVGMADFDVLQRLDNKEYKIIEINPRVPASLRGAAISGINFPEIIARDVMGLPQMTYQYSSGKEMRYLGIDIMWLLKTKHLFGNTPSWFKFFGNNIYYQDIYKTDLSTWWTWLAEGLSKLRSRNKQLRK